MNAKQKRYLKEQTSYTTMSIQVAEEAELQTPQSLYFRILDLEQQLRQLRSKRPWWKFWKA